jgi:hypothetical protein
MGRCIGKTETAPHAGHLGTEPSALKPDSKRSLHNRLALEIRTVLASEESKEWR